MPEHRVRLELTAPIGTPLASGTLFGHLCWAWRERHGEVLTVWDPLRGIETEVRVSSPVFLNVSEEEPIPPVREHAPVVAEGGGAADLLEGLTPVAARRLSALPDAAITRAWAGLYEMTPDAMPNSTTRVTTTRVF